MTGSREQDFSGDGGRGNKDNTSYQAELFLGDILLGDQHSFLIPSDLPDMESLQQDKLERDCESASTESEYIQVTKNRKIQEG